MVAGAKRQVGRGGGSSFEYLSVIVVAVSNGNAPITVDGHAAT